MGNNLRLSEESSHRGAAGLKLELAWMPPVAGVLAIGGYALSRAPTATKFLEFGSTGLMVAGTCLLLGAFLGFLFGIPRTLQQDRSEEHDTAPPRAAATAGSFDYRANTNLEQISDWLTRILVGAGLTQIPAISRAFLGASARIGEQMGGGGEPFALALLLFFLVSGFLDGYLWTRLFLPGAFRQADLSALVTRVEAVSREASQASLKVQELERQVSLDARALALLQCQLQPSADAPAPTQVELDSAVRDASKTVKIQIFAQASGLRADNWRKDKKKVALTIPLFRALVASDGDRRYHRNHGQLGYALKDQPSPDWSGAETQLTEAIAIRDRVGDSGYRLYEFNRAICRISLDSSAAGANESPPDVRDGILADLRQVARSKNRRLLSEVPDIQAWLSRNRVREL